MRRLLHTFVAGMLVLIAAASALAQSQITTGVIGGVVLDANAGVLPGVTVEVRNVDTNLTRSLVTGQDGRFSALQLPPGRYTVTFTLPGFATLVQENVVVTVGQTVPLNPTMRVSGISETVTVTTEVIGVPELVMNAFAPLITHSSPTSSARVRVAPASEPASGSVSPKPASARPATKSGSQRCC